MIFDLNNYTNGQYAMHCPERDQARHFLKFLHDNGKCWRGGMSYLDKDNFSEYEEETCYAFSEGTYADLNYFLNNSNEWKLLYFDDFDWESSGFRDLELTDKDNQKIDKFLEGFIQQGVSVNYGV